MRHRLVLASASPRRKELLAGLGLEFTVKVVGGIDESWPPNLEGQDIPLYISRKKAQSYKALLAPDELLITADTIVWLDGKVLGKPATPDEARHMLSLLSGRWHQVITGVTLLTSGHEHSFSVTTGVKFSDLTAGQIDYYVDNYRPLDKAGAYGIQEWIGYVGVEAVEGSYFNVVGLPVQRLYRELLQFDALD